MNMGAGVILPQPDTTDGARKWTEHGSPLYGNYCGCVHRWGFPGGTVVKNLPANAENIRDLSSIPRSERSPGEGNDSPLHYSCLENSMGRGNWQDTVHGVAKNWTQLK